GVSRLTERTSPFLALHREMDRLFADFLRDFDLPVRVGWNWPNVEVSEEEDQYKVLAELPGLEKGDVEVTFQDGVLRLKGEKKGARNATLYSEPWDGDCARDIEVGEDVDADGVKASFKNGLLTVTLPKKPEARRQVRRISIN